MQASPTSLAPGRVLAGKFRIERILGTGGMGMVVAAEHLLLRQRVALKLLLPEMLLNLDVVERFEREARATARLRNDHVARILDVGTLETGAPYIVMEYLEGSDLAALLAERGVLPLADAVDYVLQACEALAEAHGVGIIHRDLKPQNLFLTRTVDGAPLVKVLDFGVSRFADAAEVHLTRTSAIVGSPAYMAPEQMRAARNADERSDVWSLGVILYELLTGRLPFFGETMTDLFANVVASTPTSPKVIRPEVAAGLAAAVLRCLSIDPGRRPSSVAGLALAIAPFGGTAARAQSERIVSVTRATRPAVADASVAAVSDDDARLRLGTARSLVVDRGSRRRVPVWAGMGVAIAIVGVAGALGAAIFAAGRRHGTGPATAEAAAQGVVIPEPPPPSALPALVAPPSPELETGISTVDGAVTIPPKAQAHPPAWKPPPSAKPAASVRAPSTKDDPFQNRTSF
jgi:serine/threonine-protein kinase